MESGEARPSSPAHQFKLALSQEMYASVVQKLETYNRPSRRTKRSASKLTADVELCSQSRTFKITRLNSHTLPKFLEIPFGSAPHSQLTRLLKERVDVPSDGSNTLRRALADLIETVPDFSITSDGFVLSPYTVAASTTQRLQPIAHDIVIDVPDLLVYDEVISSHLTTSNDRHKATASERSITLSPSAPAYAEVDQSSVTIYAEFKISRETSESLRLSLFIHWGSYDDIGTPWRTELAHTVSHENSDNVEVHHSLTPMHSGRYGVTFFFTVGDNPTPMWLGAFRDSDISFRIFSDSSSGRRARLDLQKRDRIAARSQFRRALENSEYLESSLLRIRARYPMVAQGQLLHEYRRDGLLTQRIQKKLAGHSVHSAIEKLLRNETLGEVVFVSPEGPHAAAGGLAQVISGLLPALALAGIPSTLIAPLYSSRSGNKHRDAWATIREGITIGEATLYPRYIGEVSVSSPPEYSIDSGRMTRYPHSIPLQVYEAFHSSTRLLLLFNPTEFTSLYAPLAPEEQVRRSILLSRASLEVIADPVFDIEASVIVSNDWMTAPIPALARLDRRYSDSPTFQKARTLHMLHNAGSDYHGIFPTRVNSTDVWQYMGLAGEHYFGFQDTEHPHCLNLTIGGALHADGVLTVSREYAQELQYGSDCNRLRSALSKKEGKLFGISNGIDTKKIRTSVESSYDISLPTSINDAPNLDELLAHKAAAQIRLQAKMGLKVSKDASILAITGRLAEQKGLDLLISTDRRGSRSILEEFLSQSSDNQLIVAGPPASGDLSSQRFIEALLQLKWRFPLQVATQIEYVQHSNVLSILFASSLLVMPSRFEPGGIAQLEALALGTPVVARSVGGLKNTLCNFSYEDGTGNAFLCNEHSAEAFANTLLWAIETIHQKEWLQKITTNCFNSSHDWSARVGDYRAVFKDLLQ